MLNAHTIPREDGSVTVAFWFGDQLLCRVEFEPGTKQLIELLSEIYHYYG